MTVIKYKNKTYKSENEETVLDTLLKHGVDYPYSCKAGTCQSCLTKLESGDLDTCQSPALKPTLVAQNYFLACQCKPTSNIAICLPNKSDTTVESIITSLEKLSESVTKLELSLTDEAQFKAGQYINLVISETLIRSYSIANIPNNYIELHIKLVPNGAMSNWLLNTASVGETVNIRGPMGDCFYYNPEDESFPIVLAGTGTGLAPLIGVVRDALENKHKGTIILIHGGVNKSDLYLNQTLHELSNKYDNFHYNPCVLDTTDPLSECSIDELLVTSLKDIANQVRLFVCGPNETIKKLKLKAFLAGVPSKSIYSDLFL